MDFFTSVCVVVVTIAATLWLLVYAHRRWNRSRALKGRRLFSSFGTRPLKTIHYVVLVKRDEGREGREVFRSPCWRTALEYAQGLERESRAGEIEVAQVTRIPLWLVGCPEGETAWNLEFGWKDRDWSSPPFPLEPARRQV